jgi:hypothetical protein
MLRDIRMEFLRAPDKFQVPDIPCTQNMYRNCPLKRGFSTDNPKKTLLLVDISLMPVFIYEG